MKLVLRNGEVKEVDTSTIFNNQYITTDGKRVHDTEVKHIIDDIRLGEFYCSSVKQGTYDEVLAAIQKKRSKINQCSDCWWFHEFSIVKDECSMERIREGNRETTIEKRVYDISCAYKPKYGDKCIHDIDETPVLFRERQFCFFCEHPEGTPDMKPLKQFMIDNAEKYGIVPYWSNDELSIDNSFMHDTCFGSYRFKASSWHDCFELENARKHFKFYIDFKNKKFILCNSIGYEVVNYLGVNEYDYKTKTSKYVAIKNYDKFAKWIWQIVDDYKEAN